MCDFMCICNQLNGNQLSEVAHTKLQVVGHHYFCCTIPSAAYCGREKCERDVLHCCGIICIHVHRKSEWEIFSVEKVSCFFTDKIEV